MRARPERRAGTVVLKEAMTKRRPPRTEDTKKVARGIGASDKLSSPAEVKLPKTINAQRTKTCLQQMRPVTDKKMPNTMLKFEKLISTVPNQDHHTNILRISLLTIRE